MAAPKPSLRALFLEALDFADPAERAAYLNRVCGSDADLRRKLEELLASDAAASGFLTRELDAGAAQVSREAGPLNPAVSLPTGLDTKPGDTIGRYKLLEKLGEGGFGVVYMAEQREPVRRKVALKIIKVGMDTREVVARFEAERQALALMDHPNIAKILDGGVTGPPLPSDGRGAGGEGSADSQLSTSNSQLPTGRPYFVMELVRGIKITEFCDQNHLDLEERLELFLQVCHAVQHAHQKGVIHRDLKPSNILVTINDGVPVPKVIDFGIAKATQQELTEKTLFTAYGQFMGTPAYMSPEQAVMTSVDIDTRSDIYSLGVLLYELLTGKPPFDTQALLKVGLDELCRTLREVEPPRPSTSLSTLAGEALAGIAKFRKTDAPKLVHYVRGDLDWIVMKCLEKDRARRYETANGLAADLQRHLHNEPVLARAPTASYRFGKFARRNKGMLAAAAGLAAVLVVATGVSLWQARVAWKAQQEADAKAKAERAAREEAETVTHLLYDVFRSADPDRDGRTITVVEALDKAVKKLELDPKLSTNAALRAALKEALGDTYRGLGLAQLAVPLHEDSLRLYRATLGPEHRFTLFAMNKLAASYSAAGRRGEGTKLLEEALPLCRKVLSLNHQHTIDVMINLAIHDVEAGRLNEAIPRAQEALDLSRQVLGPEYPSTLHARSTLAHAYYRVGRWAEALKLREEVLALYRKVEGPEHPNTLVAIAQLADSYAQAGRKAEAFALRKNRVELSRQVNGPEHPRTLEAVNYLASSYQSIGAPDEAIQLLEQTLSRHREANGPENSGTRTVMNDLAKAYGDAGRLEEEVPLREELLASARKAGTNDVARLEKCLGDLAGVRYRLRQYESAASLYRELLESRRRRPKAEESDTVLNTTASLGRLYSDWAWAERSTNGPAASARAREGERLLREALTAREAQTNLSRSILGDFRSRFGGAVLVVALTDSSLSAEARLGQLVEVEKLLLSGDTALQRSASTLEKHKRDSAERLVRLYTVWDELAPNTGHATRAAEWKQKLADFDRTNTKTKPAGAEP